MDDENFDEKKLLETIQQLINVNNRVLTLESNYKIVDKQLIILTDHILILLVLFIVLLFLKIY